MKNKPPVSHHLRPLTLAILGALSSVAMGAEIGYLGSPPGVSFNSLRINSTASGSGNLMIVGWGDVADPNDPNDPNGVNSLDKAIWWKPATGWEDKTALFGGLEAMFTDVS